MPVILAAVEDSSNFDPLIDSLKLLRTVFRCTAKGSNPNFLKHANDIQKMLLAALNHEYSRVVGTGLATTGSFMNTLTNTDGSFRNEYKGLINPIFDAVFTKLNKHDIDQEVKQLSIIASADLVSSAHQQLTADQVNKVVQVFVSRLTHELTRETALKGLTFVALNETSDSNSLAHKQQSSTQTVQLTGLSSHLSSLLDLLNKA